MLLHVCEPYLNYGFSLQGIHLLVQSTGARGNFAIFSEASLQKDCSGEKLAQIMK